MEGRELPVGWAVAQIAELAIKVGSGATPKEGRVLTKKRAYH